MTALFTWTGALLLAFYLGATAAWWLALLLSRAARRNRLHRKRLHRLLHRIRDRARAQLQQPHWALDVLEPADWDIRLANAERN